MPGKVSRGSVVDVNLDPSVGREMMKTRPCVVIQNDIGNQNSKLTIVAAMTGAENVLKKPSPISSTFFTVLEIKGAPLKRQGRADKISVASSGHFQPTTQRTLWFVLYLVGSMASLGQPSAGDRGYRFWPWCRGVGGGWNRDELAALYVVAQAPPNDFV
jgi:mRNA-degrading endonuclease toxin of MazEF toxin-antitoxin module